MAVTHGGRAAVTHYRVLARFAAHSFLAVRLETGRTHQIRVHMAHLGFPLVGDPAYGGRPRVPAGAGPELIGSARSFPPPGSARLRATLSAPGRAASGSQFSAPLPRDMHELLVALAGSDARRRASNHWHGQRTRADQARLAGTGGRARRGDDARGRRERRYVREPQSRQPRRRRAGGRARKPPAPRALPSSFRPSRCGCTRSTARRWPRPAHRARLRPPTR